MTTMVLSTAPSPPRSPFHSTSFQDADFPEPETPSSPTRTGSPSTPPVSASANSLSLSTSQDSTSRTEFKDISRGNEAFASLREKDQRDGDEIENDFQDAVALLEDADEIALETPSILSTRTGGTGGGTSFTSLESTGVKSVETDMTDVGEGIAKSVPMSSNSSTSSGIPFKKPLSLATTVWRQTLVPALPSPRSLADIRLDSPIRERRNEEQEDEEGDEEQYGFIRRHAKDVEELKSPLEGEGRKRFEIPLTPGGLGKGGSTLPTDEGIDWEFWSEVVSDYEQVAKTRPKQLSQAIQTGIPSSLRGLVWQLMSASKDPSLESLYHSLLSQTSSHEKSISRDLARTFPSHPYFSQEGGLGQENLFNLAKAYSIYDEEVGYTQGMQFVAGVLLLNMPDEEAFCVLVRLLKSYDLRSHFIPNMPGLQLRLFQFDRLLEEMCPTVFLHLIRQGIKSSMYASQWFLTLFSYRFPLPLVCIIYDLIFAEGVEAVFRFALSLMRNNETHLLSLEFEGLLNFLKSGMFEGYRVEGRDGGDEWDTKLFAKDALKVKITPFMLDGFAQEWSEICDQQNAHAQELANLRAVNGQLSAQVRRLELNLSQINEEHVKLVKELVLVKLDREGLEEELVRYKLAFADLAHERALADSHRASVASSLNFHR